MEHRAMKLMMGVFGSSDRGKTETLVWLINLFQISERYQVIMLPKPNIDGQKDRIAVFERNGVRIGISSIGDFGLQVDRATRELAELACNIIVTATRTRGETTDAFHIVRKEYGYKEAWYEKNHNVDGWCRDWPSKGGSFEAMKESLFNQKNMIDANFLYAYIASLTDVK